ncbi:hypothetical protein JX266_013779 [Neoarthrinium moseri]|nr:hypothetical protein JX266_013779 [Neoarthrinium moseri]
MMNFLLQLPIPAVRVAMTALLCNLVFTPGWLVYHRKAPIPLTRRWPEGGEPVVTKWSKKSLQKLVFIIRYETLKFGTISTVIGETFYQDDDVTSRTDKDGNGKTRKLDLPPHAIKNTADFREEFRKHVTEDAMRFAEDLNEPAKQEALRLIRTPDKAQVLQLLIRFNYGRLWLSGSLVVLGTVGTRSEAAELGMPIVPQDAETLAGDTVPSRLIVAQMGRIIETQVELMGHALLQTILTLMNASEDSDLHMVYVGLAILSDGNELLRLDRLRHGRENCKKGYSLPGTVWKIKASQAVLVAVFGFHCMSVGYEAIQSQLPDEAKAYHTQLWNERQGHCKSSLAATT